LLRALRHFSKFAVYSAPLAFFVIAWAGLSVLLGPTRLPSPAEIVLLAASSFLADPIIRAQGGGSWGYLPHVAWTLSQFAVGFTCGAFAGIATGLFVSRSRHFVGCIGMVLEFLRAVPPLILIPLTLTLLPPAAAIEALIVGVYAALTLFTYSVEASRNVPVHLLDLAQVMGARGTRLTIDVLLPATLPELFGAMRVTLVTSVGIAVVVEYLAMPAGIGRVMNFAASFSHIDLIIVGIVWAVVITLLVDEALNLVARSCLRWKRSSLRSG